MTQREYELVPYDCIDGPCLMIHENTYDSKLGALSLDHKRIGEAIIEELNMLSDENEELNRENKKLKENAADVLDAIKDLMAGKKMTDKRFTEFEINDNVVEFKDNGVRDWYVEIELQALLNDLNNENNELKKELQDVKTSKKQLGIECMDFKMKLIEVLQKHYDESKGQTLYASVYLEIAEEMGVDLDD